MQPESSKHSPRLDDGMEAEDQTILRSGQPPRTEEWREPEPFDPGHLETEMPEEEEPAAPQGMTPADVERRSDIARLLPPHKFPANRETLLPFLQHEGAPDDVVDAIASLPARQKFATIGELVRALGIPYEEDRPT
jgi:Protein of unknown function (DUF2795)